MWKADFYLSFVVLISSHLWQNLSSFIQSFNLSTAERNTNINRNTQRKNIFV
jgi:hypothetical protein